MKKTNFISNKDGDIGELSFFTCEDGGKDILPHLRIGVKINNVKYKNCTNELQFLDYPEYKSVAILNFRIDSNYTIENLEFVGQVDSRILTIENKQLILDWLLSRGKFSRAPNYFESLVAYLTSNDDIAKDSMKYNNFIKESWKRGTDKC